MKYKYMIVPVLMSLLLCACGVKDSGANTAKEGEIMEVETSISARVIGPVIEPTWETQYKGATDTYNNVCDSYAKMQELANSDTATKKGKKAAAKVEKKYAKRIEELSTVDFSQLSSEELSSLSIELVDMITAIREARDALTLG